MQEPHKKGIANHLGGTKGVRYEWHEVKPFLRTDRGLFRPETVFRQASRALSSCHSGAVLFLGRRTAVWEHAGLVFSFLIFLAARLNILYNLYE